MHGQVEPKYILVSGATGGIGSAVCRKLSDNGCFPIIGYREAQTQIASDLAAECKGLPLRLDFNDLNSIDNSIAELSSLDWPLYGIIHCASPAPNPVPFGRISENDLEFFWKANVLGPFYLFKRIIKPCFQKARRGVIIAVTSAAMGDVNQKAMPGMGAYTISKFGLCGVLALMEAEYPWLRIVKISPGFTRTKMLSAFDERFIELVSAQTPLAEPDDIAQDIFSQLERE